MAPRGRHAAAAAAAAAVTSGSASASASASASGLAQTPGMELDPALPLRTLVVDNGGYTIKAGYAMGDDEVGDGVDGGETAANAAGKNGDDDGGGDGDMPMPDVDAATEDGRGPPPNRAGTKKTSKTSVVSTSTTTTTPPAVAPGRCALIPNVIVRTRDRHVYVGNQTRGIADWHEALFRRPVEKGYVVGWEAERAVWEHSLLSSRGAGAGGGAGGRLGSAAASGEVYCTDPGETTLVLTEAPNAPAQLQRNADEMVMEEFGFGGYVRCIGPSLNAWNPLHALFGDPTPTRAAAALPLPVECALVVDSGYSHTTVTPTYRGRPLQRGIRRLDIGGRTLTNALKQAVSLRQISLMDETKIAADVKEAVCFVSDDFGRDMERARRARGRPSASAAADDIVVDYVLPDLASGKPGYARAHDPTRGARQRAARLARARQMSGQTTADWGSGSAGPAAGQPPEPEEDALVLGVERFAVPELLFTPTDAGLRAPGVAGTAMQSVAVLPTGVQAAMLANVVVVGGNVLIPGFVERLDLELRQLAPPECEVRVRRADEPIRSTWQGGARMAANREALGAVAVTRAQYDEYGQGWVARRFGGW